METLTGNSSRKWQWHSLFQSPASLPRLSITSILQPLYAKAVICASAPCFSSQCAMCAGTAPLSLCVWMSPPALLCTGCSDFCQRVLLAAHSATPETTRTTAANSDLERELRSSVSDLQRWKSELCEIIDSAIARLERVKATLEKECCALVEEVSGDVESGLQELKDKPLSQHFNSPIANGLLARHSGKLFTCKTDFAQVRQTVDSFLYSLSLSLWAEFPGYTPSHAIKSVLDIRPNRRINIYHPASFDTGALDQRFHTSQWFFPEKDFTPTVDRGEVELLDGSKYLGTWNERNEPHGVGTQLCANGSVFRGERVNGVLHGKVQYICRSGLAFEGFYERGKATDFRRVYMPSADSTDLRSGAEVDATLTHDEQWDGDPRG